MNIIKKTLFVAVLVAGAALVSGSSAHAYYAQSRSLQQPYVQGFQQPQVAVPRSYQPYGYGYQQDAVRPLIQSQLNFVSQYTYIPAPIHPYFSSYYNYYSPYSYYGW